MVLLHTVIFEVLGNTSGGPSHDFGFGEGARLFLIRFMAIDVGKSTACVGAVYAVGVLVVPCSSAQTALTRGSQIGNVLVDDTQSFMHDRVVRR